MKRKVDCLEDNDHSFGDKALKTKDNDIVIVDENKVSKDLVINENVIKCNDVMKDISNEEFIDLNQFLQIDVSVDENQMNVTSNESTAEDMPSNDDNYMTHIYHNFRQMIDFVVSDKQLSHLFDANDSDVIQSFTCLSGLAQMLFMRLFMRKRLWIRKNDIKYPEIADNLHPVLEELIDNHFLFNVNHLSDFRESLNILDTFEMKRIARSLNGLNMNGLNTKKNISAAILKYSNTSQTLKSFSDRHSDSLSEVLLKSIKSVLKNKCFKVNEKLCDVFERMFLLFCQPEINDNDFNTSLNFEFFKLFRVENGLEFYPKYTINKNTIIYKSGDDLHRYCQAFKLEIEILSAIEKKDTNQVVDYLMNRAKDVYLNAIKDKEDVNDCLLPSFLRRYTGGQSYIRCLSHCITVLEQLKNYSEAIHILKDILLAQNVYCEAYRGRWYERLALNLHKHLKDPKSSLEMIERGLNDPFVRTGHRLALYIRRKIIQKSLKISISLLPEFDSIKYTETTICAETVKYTINDRKNIFKITDSNGDVNVIPVEDVVLNHYKNNGFTDGIHTESRIYHSILCLLFWDIIYMNDIPDVFRFQYQRFPLDFNFDQFFDRRKTQIVSLLNTLKNLNELEINNILENSWNSNMGTICGINWDNTDINQIKEISTCFGSQIITDICERLIKDFRHTRSGFPDLLVWNPSNKQIKAIEVKGPNDRVSNKQKLWLTFLQSIGVDVEICHVKAMKSLPMTESIAELISSNL